MAARTGQHARDVWAESWALTLHTFTTLLESDRLDELADDGRAIDRAALGALATHAPQKLKEEMTRHRHRIQKLADPGGRRNAAALARGRAIIARDPKYLGGAK